MTAEFAPKDVLRAGLIRSQEFLDAATADLAQDEIVWRAGPLANPIGFILWHLSRVEDRFVNFTVRGGRQVWETADWPKRLGLPANPAATGFNFSEAQVTAFPVPPLGLLLEYQRAVRQATLDFVDSLSAAELARGVEHPRLGVQPVAMLLARVIVETSQHGGQIDYIKGLKRSLD